ncbi:MAG: HAD family phosphatase [Ornithinimicrobium sp.]
MTSPAFPAAVLWDMDGTIIDTEPYWMAEETILVERAGGTWSHEEALELVGSDLNRSAEILLERTPITGSPQEIVDALQAGVIARVQERMPWRPGARELIAELSDAGVPMALVTMSWQPLARVLVGALPEGTFREVVTGDQVSDGKPHPEPYLLAARRLGVEPSECVAIEDSPTGVRSAVAAGVQTLAVSHLLNVDHALGAQQHRESLDGLVLGDLVSLFAPA